MRACDRGRRGNSSRRRNVGKRTTGDVGSTRQGFVLMAALWLLVALSAVGLDAALRHRAHRLAAANLLDSARMRAAADAGSEYARSRLTAAMLGRADELRAEASRAARQQGGARAAAGRAGAANARGNSMSSMFRSSDPASDPWRDPSGLVPSQLEWNGVTTSLVLRDPAAALNINTADATMLSQFFSLGLRLDYALANKLAASIMDWRDDDEIPQLNGGEREEYLKDGASMLPSNHAFANVDELRFVKWMTNDIFAAARPYLRVSTGNQININAAPEPVLLAIPGMDQAGAAAIIRARRSGNYPRSTAELWGILPTSTLNAIAMMSPQGGPGQGGLSNSAFARRVSFSTDQVEVIATSSMPGIPVQATTQIIVDRAINGASVSWRRLQ
jgi:general secretion pathway protein K